MKTQKVTRLLTAVLLALLIAAVPAFAILGIGDVVFDPTSYEELVAQLLQMAQQYEQLVQTYQMVRSQYDQMVFMGKRLPFEMAGRYATAVTPWTLPSATNTYGTAGGWVNALNSGAGAASAYQSASEPLGSYGSALANVPPDQLDRVKKRYGTIEITDGANIHEMETLGTLRRNAQVNDATITRLEQDSLSSDPNLNTEVAVLNKINVAAVLGLRTSQDTNKVLVELAEQDLLDAKRRRDAEARAINQHIRFMAEEQHLLQSQGITDAMTAWRMP